MAPVILMNKKALQSNHISRKRTPLVIRHLVIFSATYKLYIFNLQWADTFSGTTGVCLRPLKRPQNWTITRVQSL